MKNLKNILHDAGYYLDFISECQKLVTLVIHRDFESAVIIAESIQKKFFEEGL